MEELTSALNKKRQDIAKDENLRHPRRPDQRTRSAIEKENDASKDHID